ncbi:hypothetical protein LTR78_005344 [Recurvomyces mirabilis]|uniref:Calcineurin-like phosphoesterase domain-containing protein n=1 Tax=Recurvomyces mirabilis TaxID=574656 RepID=A0AAE1C1N6_9PEZI|nr:hypothetical protein LTR78_005344 [Recurvomyces mirabilis]KAK5152749.1 hypothetical protein LTS14_008283 [Recurvomyces mirabilis]
MALDLQKLRIVCVSDTHNHAPGQGYTLPAGDVLIHAGDLTNQGSLAELENAFEWLAKADFAYKIVVAGNHDLSLDEDYNLKYDSGWRVQAENFEQCRALLASHPNIHYLEHAASTIGLLKKNVSLNVFASPQSPDRGHQNWAFQYPAQAADLLWDAIPSGTDILITHTPPSGHCDTSTHWQEGGCPALKRRLRHVRPALHICGHCHEGRRAEVVRWGEDDGEGEVVWRWEDPGQGSKKQSLLDLTGLRGGWKLKRGHETAIVNASVMARSHGRGGVAFNKPVVVDILLPTRSNVDTS